MGQLLNLKCNKCGYETNLGVGAGISFNRPDVVSIFFDKKTAEETLAVRELLTARGSDGIGSIMGDLSSPVTTVYGNIGSSEGTNYKINRDNTWYSNAFGTGYDFPDSPGGGAGTASTLYLQVGSENSENDIISLNINNEDIY